MLDRTYFHEEQAKRFTSLISRRIGLSRESPLSVLPTPEGYDIADISKIAADIAVIKLYEAALIAERNDEMKNIISGIVWLYSKASDWMKTYLSIANLDLRDDLTFTKEKLIKLDNYNFFYNVFLENEIVIPISKFLEIYNASINKDQLSAEMHRLFWDYRELNILSPEFDVNRLLSKTKKALILKHKFENLIALISAIPKQFNIQKEKNYDPEQIIEIYRKSKSSSGKIDIASITDESAKNYDNFLINTSDITLSSNKQKRIQSNTKTLKSDVLKVLKRSNHATRY